MDKGIASQYVQFFKTNAGVDLVNRLKMAEAEYMRQGLQASTIEGKGIAMSKQGAIYAVRTMLDDLAKVNPNNAKVKLSKDA